MNKINNSWLIVLALGLILQTQLGVGDDLSSIESFLITEDATEIHRYKSDDGARSEISYQVDIKYPELAVGETAERNLIDSGWNRCKGTAKGWNSFHDSTETPVKKVHQNIEYWSHGANLLTTAMRYMSTISGADECLSVPNNSTQYVNIILDQHTPENFDKIQSHLGLDCKAQ